MNKEFILNFNNNNNIASTKKSCHFNRTHLKDELAAIPPITKLIQYLLDNKFIKDTFSLLDIGCGDGEYLKGIANNFHKSTMVGVDINPQVISPPNNLQIFKMDIIQAVENSSGDILINRNAWHDPKVWHFENPHESYKKLENLIFTNYKFFITTLTQDQLNHYKTESYYNNFNTYCPLWFDVDPPNPVISIITKT
jgi:hypothetical protein